MKLLWVYLFEGNKHIFSVDKKCSEFVEPTPDLEMVECEGVSTAFVNRTV